MDIWLIVINYLFMKIVVYMMNLPDMIVVFNSSICTYSTIFIYYIFLYVFSKTNQFTIRRTQLSIFFLFLIELQSIIEYCILLFFKKRIYKKIIKRSLLFATQVPSGFCLSSDILAALFFALPWTQLSAQHAN